MTNEEIKKTVLYKDCYERVKQFPELAGDLVYILRETFEEYNLNDWRWGQTLISAFFWDKTSQGYDFWNFVNGGTLPKEYQ